MFPLLFCIRQASQRTNTDSAHAPCNTRRNTFYIQSFSRHRLAILMKNAPAEAIFSVLQGHFHLRFVISEDYHP
jgi:hypothetical protein